ncbi:proteobacterial dedicated sortase system histidine kinase [compost metagenome]
MAGVAIDLARLRSNLDKAKIRASIYGAIFLIFVVVSVGTKFTLELSFNSVASQYEAHIDRTLERIAYEYDSLDGRISLLNISAPSAGANGIPPYVLPIEYVSVTPGHAEELKALPSCSYSLDSSSKNRVCVGVLNNKEPGAIAYIRGSFSTSDTLVSPRYVDNPATGHRFVVSISSRGRVDDYTITFDPLLRNLKAPVPYLSEAWSLTGFKTGKSRNLAYAREPEIRGRVLKAERPGDSSGDYEFIFQVPLSSFLDDAYRANKDSSRPWPPKDIYETRVTVSLLRPGAVADEKIFDSTQFQSDPIFSLDNARRYLSSGEQLSFQSKSGEVHSVRPDATGYAESEKGMLQELYAKVTNWFINLLVSSPVVTKESVIDGGATVRIQGDASNVLTGWREAAGASIAFAFVLFALLIVVLVYLQIFILTPLYKVRKNTLFMREKFSDKEHKAPPYFIGSSKSEIGVLWENIQDLHRALTSANEISTEKANRERELMLSLGHEIRSPLQSLISRHPDARDADRRDIDRISFALETLSGAYAESDVGGVEIKRHPKDIFASLPANTTSENVTEYLVNAAESHHIGGIVYDGSEEPVYALANGDMLESVLDAVINNANDFRVPDTPIVLSVGMENAHVAITVANQGPPIPESKLEEIFNYGVSLRAGPGNHLGQGLNMVRSYVASMQGKVSALNVENGVEFRIRLLKA